MITHSKYPPVNGNLWFQRRKPSKPGVYISFCAGFMGYQKWDGNQWFGFNTDLELAAQTKFVAPEDTQNRTIWQLDKPLRRKNPRIYDSGNKRKQPLKGN
jgi:hypothetical protein